MPKSAAEFYAAILAAPRSWPNLMLFLKKPNALQYIANPPDADPTLASLFYEEGRAEPYLLIRGNMMLASLLGKKLEDYPQQRFTSPEAILAEGWVVD